jgi:heme/copper-type cytochrome/quinol oxidase subunit 2
VSEQVGRSGVLWILQTIAGPLVLGLALLYATFQYRSRRRSGELTSLKQGIALAVPVIAAAALLVFLMTIPGSR